MGFLPISEDKKYRVIQQIWSGELWTGVGPVIGLSVSAK